MKKNPDAPYLVGYINQGEHEKLYTPALTKAIATMIAENISRDDNVNHLWVESKGELVESWF